jgi:hypothetical protein
MILRINTQLNNKYVNNNNLLNIIKPIDFQPIKNIIDNRNNKNMVYFQNNNNNNNNNTQDENKNDSNQSDFLQSKKSENINQGLKSEVIDKGLNNNNDGNNNIENNIDDDPNFFKSYFNNENDKIELGGFNTLAEYKASIENAKEKEIMEKEANGMPADVDNFLMKKANKKERKLVLNYIVGLENARRKEQRKGFAINNELKETQESMLNTIQEHREAITKIQEERFKAREKEIIKSYDDEIEQRENKIKDLEKHIEDNNIYNNSDFSQSENQNDNNESNSDFLQSKKSENIKQGLKSENINQYFDDDDDLKDSLTRDEFDESIEIANNIKQQKRTPPGAINVNAKNENFEKTVEGIKNNKHYHELDPESIKRGVIARDQEVAEKQKIKDDYERTGWRAWTQKTVDVFNFGVAPIYEQIKKINEQIYNKIVMNENYKIVEAKQYFDEVKPFVEKLTILKKTQPEEYKKFFVIWNWKSQKDLVNFMEKHNLINEFKKVHEVLNNLYNEQLEAGIELPYTDFYTPSKVENVEGLMEEIEQSLGKEISGDIAARAFKVGIATDTPEYTRFVNQYLRGFVPNSILLSPTNFTKRETLEKNIDNLKYVRYYQDPMLSLKNYINGSVISIRDRRLFGKVAIDEQDKVNTIKRISRKLKNLEKRASEKVKANEIIALESRRVNAKYRLDSLRLDLKKASQGSYSKESNKSDFSQSEKSENINQLQDKINKIETQLKYMEKQIDFFKSKSAFVVKKIKQKQTKLELEQLKKEYKEMNKSDNLENSLGAFVNQLNLPYKEAQRLNELLKSLYAYNGQQPKILSYLSALSPLYMLSGFKNSIKQLGEIGNGLAMNGVTNTFKSLKDGNNFFIETGLDNDMFSEFEDDAGKVKKFSDGVMAMTGFNLFDKFGKNNLMNGAFLDTIDKLEKNDPETLKLFFALYEDKATDVIKEILSYGNKKTFNQKKDGGKGGSGLSMDALTFLLYKLGQAQPMHKGDKPPAYYKHPSIRFMYGMKGYFIKQLANFHRDVIKQFKDGNTKQAVINVVKLQLYTWLTGVPISLFTQFLFDDDDEEVIIRGMKIKIKKESNDSVTAQIVDLLFENILLNNVVNKFNIEEVAKGGPASVLFSQMQPVYAKPLLNLSKDVMNAMFKQQYQNKFAGNIAIYKNTKQFYNKWFGGE